MVRRAATEIKNLDDAHLFDGLTVAANAGNLSLVKAGMVDIAKRKHKTCETNLGKPFRCLQN